MNRRIKVLQYTWRNRSLGGSFSDWILNCFSPKCGWLAQHVIAQVTQDSQFWQFHLKNSDGILYYSRELPLQSLYQTITEQSYLWQWHYYQIPQTRVTAEDVVFDCGTAEGIFSFLVRSHAKHIYSFEPLPDYLPALAKTFEQDANVSIIPQALGNSIGIAYLHSAGVCSKISEQDTGLAIAMNTIDHFCATQPTVINYLKADLEGYELNLLAGAKEAIWQFRPKIAITTYHQGSHAQEIRQLLQSIHPRYNILVKGIEERQGAPVMLHAW
ncbi:MAG: FkbM family methyltransferase [Microcoleaceae cyanobacterium]